MTRTSRLLAAALLLLAAPAFAHERNEAREERADRAAEQEARERTEHAQHPDRSKAEHENASKTRDQADGAQKVRVDDKVTEQDDEDAGMDKSESGRVEGEKADAEKTSGQDEVNVAGAQIGTDEEDSEDKSGDGGGDTDKDENAEATDDNSGHGSGDNDLAENDEDADADNSGHGGSGDDDDDKESESGRAFALERDSDGRERRSGEVVVVGRDGDIDAMHRHGYAVLSRERLEGRQGSIARLKLHRGEDMKRAIDRLREIAPRARVAPNHAFRVAEAKHTPAAATGQTAPAPLDRKVVVGLIDTGIDPLHGSLRGAVASTRAFAGDYAARPHGAGVAAVVVQGGATVAAADVFEIDAHGAPVASADAIVRALDWFAAQGVGVVNISLSGPDNVLVSDAIARAQASGMVIVAAAGNEGPNALPAFPASYAGVIAVTAIDADGNVYRRANRGDYIDFAALGVHVPVADQNGQLKTVSGTSFAAPRVSALLAKRLGRRTSAQGARRVVNELARSAIDLGPKGRDPIFGWGRIP